MKFQQLRLSTRTSPDFSRPLCLIGAGWNLPGRRIEWLVPYL